MGDIRKTDFLCMICSSVFSDDSYEYWTKWHKEHPEEWRKNNVSVRGWPRKHHTSLEDLYRAVEGGCFICKYISKREDLVETENSPSASFLYRLEGSTPSYRLFIKRVYPHRSIEFAISLIRPPTTLDDLAARSRSQAWTGDENVSKLAKGWLTRCLEEHNCCSDGIEQGWHPTRLLDVSTEVIRLCNFNHRTFSGSYATLSHCWGTESFDMLNTNTLPVLETGRSLLDYPATFQQAIMTVRRLGIPYIWIDCYCILQGGDAAAQADWEYEAARMGKVYSNAVINIGAAHSSGPAEGLFAPRTTGDLKTIQIQWRPRFIDERSTYQIDKQDPFPLARSISRVGKTKLLKRGWVVQETVLSRRMLVFNGPDICWMCPESAACEDYPDENKPIMNWALDFPFWALTPDNRSRRNYSSKSTSQLPMKSQLMEQWFHTLASYCQASLTFPDKDIFTALEGIGQHMSNAMADVYYRGLLGKTLPAALLWTSKSWAPGRPSFKRSPSTRAPTWHWASYEGPHDFENITQMFRNAREGAWIVASTAYVFMSDDCNTLPSPTTLWPSLMCIGKLVKVGISQDISGFHECMLHPWNFPSELLWGVWLDSGLSDQLADFTGSYALLSLISITSMKMPDNKHIEGLFLLRKAEGVFQRMGTFSFMGLDASEFHKHQKLVKTTLFTID